MISRKCIKLLVLILFMSFLLAACAKQGQIGDVMIMDDTNSVLVYARLQNIVIEDSEQLIYAGVPVTCTFDVRLYQVRPYWIDRKVARQVVRNVIKYDNVRKTIFLTTGKNENDREVSEYRDIAAAETSLFDLNGVALADLGSLEKTEKYYVAIKAKIRKDEHSPFVRYILLFMPFLQSETNWYRKEFVWKN